MSKPVYSTVEKIRKYLSMASQNQSDDDMLAGYLHRASRSIDAFTRRHFYPLRKTYYYDYDQYGSIRLDRDLLSLDSLYTQNGGSLINNNILYSMVGNNYNYSPYDKLVIRDDTGVQLTYSGTGQQANEVTGFWGYHEDYENAWVDTGTSLAAGGNLTDTVLTIAGAGSTGAGASNVNFESPRMAPGDLMKVGDELVNVVGSYGNSSPIVIRAQCGTSATTHASGTAIYSFSPEPDIQWATERLAAWMYGQQSTPYETKTAYVGIGGLTIPQGLAVDVKQRLDRFKRITIMVYPDRH